MQHDNYSYLRLIIILGLISMLMPLSIDMYLPSLPSIAKSFNVNTGQAQMTLNSYILGFSISQLFYGPMSDSIGRKPVILGGVIIFSITSWMSTLANNIEQFIFIRFLQGLSAAAASVVITALMRDMFCSNEFSRSMSFVLLVMTIAPLLAPILGGMVMIWFSWRAIFWIISLVAIIVSLLIIFFVQETLPKEKRQKFNLQNTIKQLITLFRDKKVFCYILSSGFSFAGLFSFLNTGPFVYIELYNVLPQNFGYYFALNIIFLFLLTILNSYYVRRFGALKMLHIGLTLQFIMGMLLILNTILNLGFITMIFGIAIYVGSIAMISSNAMSVILDNYPHIAGTVSSLVGTVRFSIGAFFGYLISCFKATTAWSMVGFMGLSVCLAMGFILLSNNKLI
ncbi:MAG: Bcr/CflA family multidrug efflux MFS transporter [Arsenophonus endosymbiont of Ceratovacuna japonica]